MVKLRFHGHSCWEVDDGTHRVLIDPFLSGNELADVGPDAFDKLDAILITHGHGDHVGDAIQIAERSAVSRSSTGALSAFFTAVAILDLMARFRAFSFSSCLRLLIADFLCGNTTSMRSIGAPVATRRRDRSLLEEANIPPPHGGVKAETPSRRGG